MEPANSNIFQVPRDGFLVSYSPSIKESGMYDHIGLKVKNVDASVRFYEQALKALGHVVASRDASGAGIGPARAPALWLYAGELSTGSGIHVAFRATNRAAVDAFHRDGLKAGGHNNGAPGVRANYSANYYAAFLLDPDGNNVEAAYLG